MLTGDSNPTKSWAPQQFPPWDKYQFTASIQWAPTIWKHYLQCFMYVHLVIINTLCCMCFNYLYFGKERELASGHMASGKQRWQQFRMRVLDRQSQMQILAPSCTDCVIQASCSIPGASVSLSAKGGNKIHSLAYSLGLWFNEIQGWSDCEGSRSLPRAQQERGHLRLCRAWTNLFFHSGESFQGSTQPGTVPFTGDAVGNKVETR